MMLVTASLVFIALGGKNGDLPESWVRCDPLDIMRVDPIPGQAPSNPNL